MPGWAGLSAEVVYKQGDVVYKQGDVVHLGRSLWQSVLQAEAGGPWGTQGRGDGGWTGEVALGVRVLGREG